ncbi:secretion system protein [Mixta theicola]|uniref:Secretion system protein n=1 Tax=Mixta theicola TaxID=1458355 RepID=A0A2K1Q9Z4_9GAMM|nr:type II secretion system F family protein [Mixta theicola]PNS11845.1 secretion system protein [Mixta theicola]GLR07770.1 tight adherance operon protein [Mixta theicola]
MSYWVLFIGGAIFLLNYFQWKKLTRAIAFAAPSRRQFPPLAWLLSLGREWQSYALGDRSMKGMKSALLTVMVIVLLLFLNANWFNISLLAFIPAVLLTAFIGQIRIGRILRRRYFEDRFPEVLSVVNAAVSAGNSIHQALHRCGEGVEGELGQVFHRIDRRLNLGEEPERVFNDAWQDYRYREFYFFVVVMLVSLQHGGQLRTLVGRLSRIISNSKNIARRKAAMTSEARASAKIVAAIPLLFFCGMKYFSPENFDFIIHDSTGQYILYYVIASESIGMAIIWFLLRRAL